LRIELVSFPCLRLINFFKIVLAQWLDEHVVKELNHLWVYDVLSKLLFFGWKDADSNVFV
jgi:hypothetical protein